LEPNHHRINELVAGMEETADAQAAVEEVRRREAAGRGAGQRLGGLKEKAAAAGAEMTVMGERDETWEIMDGQEIQVSIDIYGITMRIVVVDHARTDCVDRRLSTYAD
jgi:hypothetical protein